MIIPRINSFVVFMLPPPKDDVWVEGRVKAIDLRTNDATVWVVTGPMQVDEIICPPWQLQHCHHQPVKERVKIDGDFVWVDGADDSLAWRLTREAIATAMMMQKPLRRDPLEDA